MKNILSEIAFVVAIFALIFVVQNRQSVKVGSVVEGQAYRSTVTAPGQTNSQLLKLGYGSLAQVVITGAAAGTFEFYDATTTNGLIRTITATTSLMKLASFPTNAAVGTYTFDASFSQGLIVAFTGTQGTTSVMWR